MQAEFDRFRAQSQAMHTPARTELGNYSAEHRMTVMATVHWNAGIVRSDAIGFAAP